MKTVLTDVSAPAMIAAIEANWSASFVAYTTAPQVQSTQSTTMTSVMTGVPSPWYNGVFHTCYPGEAIDGLIAETLSSFQQYKIPFGWWAGHTSRPVDLDLHLQQRGLQRTVDLIGMAADLQALALDRPLPAGLEIASVRDRAGLRDWMEAYIGGMGANRDVVQVAGKLYLDLGLGPENAWQYLLARWHGQPVATLAYFFGAGVVGIYSVATIPQARSRGIATALVKAAMHAAWEQDYRIAILHATPMGRPVYRKLGFQEYCTLRGYLNAKYN